jgi:Flp pilus assembly protein TadD
MGAALAALLFAVHPQRAESVGWVTDRATVLSAFFYLLAVLGYLRAVEHRGGIRWRWAGLASLLAFAAALLSKGITMTLPVSLLVLDLYPLRRWELGWVRLVAEKVPYLALALLGAAVTLGARIQGAQLTHFDHYDFGARVALATYSLWFYPSRLIWPHGLSPLYEHPLHASILEWHFLGPALAVAVVTIGLVLLRRRFPGGLAAWVHSAVVVGPVSGIVHSGSQLVSDRYAYLAGLGFVTILGFGLVWVLDLYARGRLKRPIAAAAVLGSALIVIALGVGARVQVQLWHDSEMLWRWAVDKDPTCALCHAGLGAAILEASGGAPARMDEAERSLRRAIALRDGVAIAYAALGTIETDRGRDREAEAALRTYMQLAPQSPDGPERLALLFLASGRAPDALPLLHRARDLRGAAAPTRSGPSVDGMPGRDPRAAPTEAALGEAVDLIGANARMLQYLGHLLVHRGHGAAALVPLRRAVVLTPADAVSRFWLVKAYLLEGRLDQARRETEALRAVSPRLAEIAWSQMPATHGGPGTRQPR